MKKQLQQWTLGLGLCAGLCLGSSCGGAAGGGNGGYRVIIPAGTITSISPSSVTAGGPPFTLTINGSGFTYAQFIVFNGGPPMQLTGPPSDTQIMLVVDSGAIANPGSIPIYLGSSAPATKPSNTVTLTVNAHTTTACTLFGLYHFLFTGFDKNGPLAIAGAFGIDAGGNVTGEEDFFDPVGERGGPFIAGTCTNSTTSNQGTLSLTVSETFNYTFVLLPGSGGTPRGQLAESDDAVPFFGPVSGSGVFVQVPTGASLSGDYAFGLVGSDPSSSRTSVVGRFTASNGNLSAGFADINDAGTVTPNASVTGTVYPSDQYSRIGATLMMGGENHGFSIYVNSSSDGFVIDHWGGSGEAALAGILSSQGNAGTYNNSNLNGPLVFSTWGETPGSTASSDTTLGLASGFNSGAGTFDLQFDNVSGGVAGLNQTVTGATYDVASNGRATVSYTSGGKTVDYVYYLDDSNDGFIIGESGNTVEFGFFQPQATGPFTTSTINGTFASATFLPVVPTSPNLATEITLNNGNISASTAEGTLTGTYTVSASGRGTATVDLPVLGGSNLVLYIISPTSVEVMGSGNTTADAITFMHF